MQFPNEVPSLMLTNYMKAKEALWNIMEFKLIKIKYQRIHFKNLQLLFSFLFET